MPKALKGDVRSCRDDRRENPKSDIKIQIFKHIAENGLATAEKFKSKLLKEARKLMIKKFSIKLVAVLVIGLIAFVMSSFAQSAVAGAINGKITDPQGAVVPNAAIIVTNIGTNQSVTINSSDDGTYKVTNLQPGTYTVYNNGDGIRTGKSGTCHRRSQEKPPTWILLCR